MIRKILRRNLCLPGGPHLMASIRRGLRGATFLAPLREAGPSTTSDLNVWMGHGSQTAGLPLSWDVRRVPESQTILWRRNPALHPLKVLSPPAGSGLGAPAARIVRTALFRGAFSPPRNKFHPSILSELMPVARRKVERQIPFHHVKRNDVPHIHRHQVHREEIQFPQRVALMLRPG